MKTTVKKIGGGRWAVLEGTKIVYSYLSQDHALEMAGFAFVEKTGDDHWAVKRKEAKEFVEESIVLEVFDDEKMAQDFRDEHNRRMFPAGHDRNPEPVPGMFAKKGQLETETLTGVEIFSAGTWTDMNGRKKTYTAADIDQMVSNAESLRDRVKPFFKLMHLSAKDHKRVTAAPAIGWLTNFRRSGKKLVVDIERVPKKVAQLIRAGSFRRISAEIFTQFRDEASGKTLKNVVGAAGLLGAVLPAITTLSDVLKLFGASAENQIEGYNDFTDWADDVHVQPASVFMGVDFNESPQGGESEMDKEEVQRMIDAAVGTANTKHSKEMSEFKSGINKSLGVEADADPVKAIESLKSDQEAKDKALADEQTANFTAQVDAAIDAAVREGMAPALKPTILAAVAGFRAEAKAAEDGKVSFQSDADDEKTKVTGTPIEVVKAYVAALPKDVELGKERGRMGDPKDPKKQERVVVPMDIQAFMHSDRSLVIAEGSMQLNQRILKTAKDEKTDYLSAFTMETGVVPSSEPDPASYAMSADGEIIR